MPIIFQPVKISNPPDGEAGLELKNRLVRSATGERMVDKEGRVTDELVKLYEQLARGGVGTIITGHSFVRPDGKSGWQMMGIHQDDMIIGLRRLARVVGQYDARILVQLNHTGRYAPGAIIGTNPLTPSVTEETKGMYPPREMNEKDIGEIIQAFGQAAARAQEAGFDGVQIHAAHGYLVSQFLSPLSNRRTDAWGGDVRNRAKFLLEIYKNIRQTVGNKFAVWVKINCEDFVEGGFSLQDSLFTAGLLEKESINLIEISGGVSFQTVIRSNIGTKEPEACFLPQAEQFRARLKVPLSLVGGIRSLKTMEMLIKDKGFDLVSLCRPLIYDPGLPLKLARKDLTQSECTSCNKCLTMRKSEPVQCRQDKN